jgi:ATP synthase protein I
MPRTAKWVLRGQLSVTIVSAALWWLLGGPDAALAAFAGGMIALLPNLYLALKVFSRRAAASPKTMVRAFYTGEAVKFGLTVILFAIAIQRFSEQFLPVIATFIVAVFVYWVALAGAAQHTPGKEQ